MARQSFGEFMKKVNSALEKKCGLGAGDMEDYCYRDAYDDGDSPSAVARAVLANSGAGEFGID